MRKITYLEDITGRLGVSVQFLTFKTGINHPTNKFLNSVFSNS